MPTGSDVALPLLLAQAAALGLIQGVSEFLPISSSGHLILARDLLHWPLFGAPDRNTAFDVAVHAGTFLSLLVYFRSDLARLLRAFAHSLRRGISGDPDRRLAWLLLLGTVPAALSGVGLRHTIEQNREQAVPVAVLLITFGLLLWLAEWRGTKTRNLAQARWLDALLIGLGQALALAPGVSRSGVTMTVGLARGMTREVAARFSFLLSIPIVGGVAAYSLLDVIAERNAFGADSFLILGVGLAAAALSGYLCIRYFLRYLQTRSLAPFVIYRLIVGIALLVWFGLHAG